MDNTLYMYDIITRRVEGMPDFVQNSRASIWLKNSGDVSPDEKKPERRVER